MFFMKRQKLTSNAGCLESEDSMNKVSIFSASIGNGHNEASKALQEQFLLHDDIVTVVDTFQSIHPLLHKLFLDSYLNMLRLTPRLWGKLYEYGEAYSWFLLMDRLGSLFSEQLYSLILTHQTTVMISTHPFVTAFLARLKKKKRLDIPLYTVITDFHLHPAYLRPEIDGYFTASPQFELFAKRYKVPLDKFFYTGIPIKAVPDITLPRWRLRTDLNVQPHEKTVLITGGGLGLGNYFEILKTLDILENPIQLLIMTGMNTKLNHKLRNYQGKHHIHVIPFTEQFTSYLRASDIVISKAGGLTMCEALACETPIIIYKPLPGHEEQNAEILIGLGTAVKAKRKDHLLNQLKQMLNNERFYDGMVNRTKLLKQPAAAKNIVSIIQKSEKRK